MSIAVPPARTSAHPGDPPADQRLLSRFAATRAAPDRERLVVRYLPLARFAANHYARDADAFDDLMQVASVGLLKAIDRFDPENGASFPSYALPTMFGELRRHFRDHSWAVRPPRTLLEHALQVERATAELTEALGRSPAVDEVAAHTGLSCEQVLDAREAAVAHTATSLSAPVGDGDGDAVELGDHLGSDDTGYARRRGPRDGDVAAARAQPPRPRDRPPAAGGGPHPARDRRARRPLADARLADPARRVARPPAGGGRLIAPQAAGA